MATTIGEATIKLTFDNKSLDKSATQAESKVKSVLSSLGTTAKVAGKVIGAGIAAAKAAVVGLGKVSIQTYAEYEQLVGGVKTLFGDSADEMQKYAKEAYKTAQMSAAQFMETSISFSASLVQGLGNDTAKAAEYANRAIIDMADNANKMGTDISRIQDAYRGFARQQYNMLDNLALGYGGTKQEMERLIKNAASYKKEQEELNVVVEEGNLNFANIVNAISVVQRYMGIAGTSAEEAAHTIQGSFKSMKAAAQDLITGLADPDADLGKLMDNLVNSIVGTGKNDGFLSQLEPAIERTLKAIATIIEKGVPKLAEMLPGLLERTLPGIAEAAVTVITAITNILPTLAPVLADGLSVLIQELVPYLPQIIGSLVQAIATFWFEGWKHTFETFGEMFSVAFETYGGIAMDAINKIKAWLLQASLWVYHNVLQPVGAFFNGLWNGIKAGAQGVGNFIQSVFGAIVGFIKAPINAIIDGVNKILGKINGISIPDWVPGIGGSHTNFAMIPKLAQGGIATRATGAMIGEAGAEAVIPLERNTGNWAGLLSQTLADTFEERDLTAGGGITVYMTNEINNNLDADEIGRRLLTSIRRAA